ncbi:rRNA pseudouridine synthase [Candidatus Woesearchaeota archaeon]|nr:rRNA pseudouridine synthase [Candidatus Woesearchaeota archaeon]
MSKKISLKQFLMGSGKFDKVYDCIQAIKSGKVTIGKKTALNPNYFFNPKKDLVKINNEKIRKAPKLYFLMNKPAGYLCQKAENEKTIYNLLEKLDLPKPYIRSLSAVGRLDRETEGLLLITNDGKLSNIVMDPEDDLIKRYYAVLEHVVDINNMKLLEKGIQIDVEHERYKTKPCRIKVVGEKEVYISISEGKKRQIRKMFDAIGNKVVYLRRVSIGGLPIGNIKVGEIIKISREEIMEKLFQ